MTEEIKMCTILSVPDDQFIDAARVAIQENSANAPIRRLPPGLAPGAAGPAEMAVLTAKRWKPGRTLRIRFMGGDSRVRERLIPFARMWEDHANIHLDFVSEQVDDAEIRIAFANAGSWSYLGTDALVISPSKATMNYGWLEPDGPDDEYRRVVLHEFGHALSAVHEHAHPEQGIPWDLDKVYEYYELTQGWTRDEVDRQVLMKYEADETNFSAYDRNSIMHYPVSNALTQGNFEIGWNRDLSAVDKQFIATIYPPAEPTVQTLVPGQSVEASIGAHGEEDLYEFTLASADLVRLVTSGPSDVVMGLYGPNDTSRLRAFDDDSGQGFNAKITRFLRKGRYHVRVRHWHPRRTGAYAIKLET